ncbi:MAG: endonuclease V [Brevinematales bacterium]|nr:endonuclease V [Brevinematales bacterium]
MRTELIERTLTICRSGDIPSARAFQKELLALNNNTDRLPPVKTVAGVDVAYSGNNAFTAAVVMDYLSTEVIEENTAVEPIAFPYITGLLAYREFPVILRVIGGLKTRPDLIVFDGHGIAHPGKMGIAAHSGILLDIPSVGCAKSLLCGEYDPPGNNKFDFSELRYHKETVGYVVCTRKDTKPIFVSPGYRVSLEDIIEIVRRLTGKFRLPLPTHLADRLSKKIKP